MAWTKEQQDRFMTEYYPQNREKILAKNQKWREAHREQHLENARVYHHANKDAINARRRQQRKDNPEHYSKQRRHKIYGLTAEGFKAMLKAQGGCCAICRTNKKLVVDHDHKTGEVRALLCSPCNTAFGLLKEDVGRMKAMIEYAAMMKAKAAAGLPPQQQVQAPLAAPGGPQG